MLAWYFRIRCNILMIIQGKKIDQPSGWCTRVGWNLLTKMDLIGNSAESVKFLSSNRVLSSLWGMPAQKMNNSMIYYCHVMGIIANHAMFHSPFEHISLKVPNVEFTLHVHVAKHWYHISKSKWRGHDTSHLHAIIRTYRFNFDVRLSCITALMSKTKHQSQTQHWALLVIYAYDLHF